MTLPRELAVEMDDTALCLNAVYRRRQKKGLR